MLRSILSDDLPRSRWLALALLAILVGLAVAPFLFPGAKSLNVAAKICVFIVLAASFDLLLGYTGIVSFAHTMFFGIGAYGVAISLTRMGAGWDAVAVGTVAGLVVAIVLATVIGLFSLRVRTIFFAMITLAVASAFAILASQLSDLTGGEDGLNYRLPAVLRSSFSFGDTWFGVRLNGRLLDYYLVYGASLVLILILLRIVNSPFGSVLMAIRENPFRAEAIGYRTVVYRTIASCIAAATAALAGALLALWSSQTNPDTTLSFDIMVDILLMVVIGGMGTMYGAVIGAVLLVFAQNYLQDLLAIANKALVGVPLLANLFHPDRWLLWLGVAFILCVYFFPTGIVGRLRQKR
ncbi:branched-chain amino acid ABC transporter permease [Reyranella sp.]|jgi:branched-chain amino acid transport system permease protein|uniref:branched-chain amino acid ABC transporter permease n=1 Tax=Reyranella sp. TaxID=1929291 RepID=UPI000BD5C8C3|nr:branched-chain amino acid ABC transporter permease [Reyranella sp.]OYY40296.1 MAG: branched-chain amino acid ABC transporter permease [Rhodospirillales bacterium 35-66-84]OYZ92848.1 MAG: branched-chain amino acid ABC transporter permease [Rhodospirillales bacterium 24-66-33]OZB22569.1 MAG: branched-chain amino acid ABC transporter permease [Rhodospirillales bacterium 39-66-50]HQS18909.1 branched-chain amino acid ABC transporter permease [Reyranella sp.]HQT12322.1 branched-chain amino acid A